MNKIFDNKQEFTELYRDAVMSISGKSVEAASDLDRFNALAKLVAEKAAPLPPRVTPVPPPRARSACTTSRSSF